MDLKLCLLENFQETCNRSNETKTRIALYKKRSFGRLGLPPPKTFSISARNLETREYDNNLGKGDISVSCNFLDPATSI